MTFPERLGRVARTTLRLLGKVARPVAAFDRMLFPRAGRVIWSVGEGLARACARAHRGNAQDLALLYLAGLALLLVARLFGS